MFLLNEKNEAVDVNELKAELADFEAVELLDEAAMEEKLGEYYASAMNNESASLDIKGFTPMAADAASLRGLGRGILGRIREFICKILSEDSTVDQIIDAILSAIISIIPGGGIIKVIVKKLIRFIINLGVGKFCPA